MEQRWLMRRNGSPDKDGFYGMFIQGKQAVAYLNIGGENGNLHQIVSDDVVKDDENNTATLSFDGRRMRFYFNDRLVGEKQINEKRHPGMGKLEVAPITANSLRNGIQELRLFNRSILPEEVKGTVASFCWKAPKSKQTINEEKVIRKAGQEKKYRKQ